MRPTDLPLRGDPVRTTLLCFSHLRWHSVYQRPQHLMARFARIANVFYIEEPGQSGTGSHWLEVRSTPEGVTILTPRLCGGADVDNVRAQKDLLDRFLATRAIEKPTLWYYTPMSLAFSGHLQHGLIVYDCMDELSAFLGAPAGLIRWETELLRRADVVFTGGPSLYEAKRNRHPNVHCFPSSVDVAHFGTARAGLPEPSDQAGLPAPRLGFYGVLDERFDAGLLQQAAQRRPDWQFILLGPVVKIDEHALPKRPNIHYLGARPYTDLPAYAAHWDVALMPFAINAATRFISPTKTPEYLAAGLPVVSTPIVDVIQRYGDCRAVHIAGDADALIRASERALEQRRDRAGLWKAADAALQGMSWDTTWDGMARLMWPHAPVAPHVNGARRGAASHRPKAAYDYLVVGAGFAGSVMAERLAADAHKRVLVIDRRPHIGGNAYDEYNADGLLVHRYGPHIFHTNSEKVMRYLSRFTGWRPYEHRVLAQVKGQLVPIPINLTTLRKLYGRSFTPQEAEAFFRQQAEPVDVVRTSEDVIVSTIGRELYELFFQGYTRKQWGIDPSELDRSVTARIPTRTNDDDRYFGDTFQCMPEYGYTRMFDAMLDHPNIDVLTATSYQDIRGRISYRHLIYCGPIDEFFDYRFGRLPYRSLEFRHQTLDQPCFQPTAVVNYPQERIPYTRITEYKYLTGQTHRKTAITYEYPRAQGDPYYPVPRPANAELYRKYQTLADRTAGVTFVGRLATYRYYNMDQVVAQALATYKTLMENQAPAVASPPAQGAQAVATP